MRLTKINTGIVTQVPKDGGKVTVSYPDDKYLKYIHQFNYDTKGKEVN